MSRRRTAVILFIIILLILIAAFAYVYFVVLDRADDVVEVKEVKEYFTPPVKKQPQVEAPSIADESEPYVSPVDFEGLWQQNEDVYAWLDIPDSDISHPVLNRAGDNSFYMDHNTFAEDDGNGALFTEDFNKKDFSDPVTVIYGHRSGILFNVLPGCYSSQEQLEQHSEITIYLPDREYHFKVFAAVPYRNVHLLQTYDFSRRVVFDAFIKDIYAVRSLDAVRSEEDMPEFGDHIVILSTCVGGDRSKRFLVLAKMVMN